MMTAICLILFVMLFLMLGSSQSGIFPVPMRAGATTRFDRFCIFGAASSLLCLLLLLYGRQQVAFKGRPYSAYDLAALFPGAGLVIAMCGAILYHPVGKLTLSTSDPKLQERVCDAARSDAPKDLITLLDRGADPNSCEEVGDEYEVCALTMAVTHANKRCVDVLLNHGANPDGAGSTEYPENTPIEAAVIVDDESLLRSLIKAGAHPLIKDSIAVKAAIYDHKVNLYPAFLEAGVCTEEYNQIKEQAIKSKNTKLLQTLQRYHAVPKN